MSEYKRISTSPEVWAVINARHHDELCVFSSYSAPAGDGFGDMSKGRMMTEYGFKEAVSPFIGAETTWDINREKPGERNNVQHEDWLCAPLEEED